MCQKILNNTLKNASFGVIFQVFFKTITFALNAFSIRYISKDFVGVINVRLQLLETTILFLSREAFRRAALTQAESYSWQQIINLTWLTVPLSVIMSAFFCFIWLHILQEPSFDILPHYTIGVWSVGIGCVIEMIAEPLYIVSQAYSFIITKIALATMVVVVRASIFVSCIMISSQNAILAFSLAQLISNLLYSISYYLFFYMYIWNHCIKKEKHLLTFIKQKAKRRNPKSYKPRTINESEKKEQKDLIQKNFLELKHLQKNDGTISTQNQFPFFSFLDFFPKAVKNQNWIHPNAASLTWSFFKQGILKQILTEGERYIMTLFSAMSFKEQGVYDIINNLGSLVVRFLFRPVEESLYFYFTQSIKRGEKMKDQNKEVVNEISTVLQQSLNSFVAIGILIFTYSQSFSRFFLHLYGGGELAAGEGPILLKAYSFSVLLLGINGITECFVFSTMSSLQLNKHNYLMAVFSIMFLGFSWFLSQLFGSLGFILANCCNMLIRILHSLNFINNKYYETSYNPLFGLFPPKYYSGCLLFTFILTKITENYCNDVQHFLTGIFSLTVVLAVWGLENKKLIILALKNFKNKPSKKNQ